MQYTLGRAFFQEAYLTVDYERRNFSVSQCSWDSSASEQVATIYPKDYHPTPNNSTASPAESAGASSKASIPVSTIIGIVVGIVAVIILISAGMRFFLQHKRHRSGVERIDDDGRSEIDKNGLGKGDLNSLGELQSDLQLPQLHGDHKDFLGPELPSPQTTFPMQTFNGKEVSTVELESKGPVYELDSSTTGAIELESPRGIEMDALSTIKSSHPEK